MVHPEFSRQNVAHDIAIVKLSSAIEMTDFIQPACLWTEDEEQFRIVGKLGTMVGFGNTEDDTVSEYLQEANLTVVEGLKCLEDARKSLAPILTSNMFCSRGTLGVSACRGDSGGGMFFKKNTSCGLGLSSLILVQHFEKDKVLISNLEGVRDIVLDPQRGKLYWANHGER
ncbi:hypothetical protein ZHAS_00018204 [Anopheles sinensis]|uniref:Peptidase S1 domain-containing protein n=1 Tax=Anopheles sinensis TaxID=74873 RepID=A0A084WHK7_ANOSI|nr:hypothetical protein ZHAS_00018204 [Anopheles sinensis]